MDLRWNYKLWQAWGVLPPFNVRASFSKMSWYLSSKMFLIEIDQLGNDEYNFYSADIKDSDIATVRQINCS